MGLRGNGMHDQEVESLVDRLSQVQREKLYRHIVKLEAELAACKQVLDGQEPSDFMLSFPLVKEVWDLRCAADDLKRRLK